MESQEISKKHWLTKEWSVFTTHTHFRKIPLQWREQKENTSRNRQAWGNIHLLKREPWVETDRSHWEAKGKAESERRDSGGWGFAGSPGWWAGNWTGRLGKIKHLATAATLMCAVHALHQHHPSHNLGGRYYWDLPVLKRRQNEARVG